MIGPILSMDQQSAMVPCLETRPKVGRSELVEHATDGETIEPRVSVPMAKATPPAAAADAEPAEEPLEPREVSQGLRTLPEPHVAPRQRAHGELGDEHAGGVETRDHLRRLVEHLLLEGLRPPRGPVALAGHQVLDAPRDPVEQPEIGALRASARAALSSARSW